MTRKKKKAKDVRRSRERKTASVNASASDAISSAPLSSAMGGTSTPDTPAPAEPVPGAVAAIDAALASAEGSISADNGGTTADAFLGAPVNEESVSAPRKRGRPRGSRTRPHIEEVTGGAAPPTFDAFPGETERTTRHEPMTGAVQGSAKALNALQRENERLKRRVGELEARVDADVGAAVKNSFAGLLLIYGRLRARQYGDHWAITKEEADEAGGHIGTALIPFMGGMEKYIPFVLAVGSTAAIMIPRAEYEAEIRAGLKPRLMNGQPMAAPKGLDR
jgi:hypothetical protein